MVYIVFCCLRGIVYRYKQITYGRWGTANPPVQITGWKPNYSCSDIKDCFAAWVAPEGKWHMVLLHWLVVSQSIKAQSLSAATAEKNNG